MESQEQEQSIRTVQISEGRDVDRSEQKPFQDLSGRHDTSRQSPRRAHNYRNCMYNCCNLYRSSSFTDHMQNLEDSYNMHLHNNQDLLLQKSSGKTYCSREDLQQDETRTKLEELVTKLPEKLQLLEDERSKKNE